MNEESLLVQGRNQVDRTEENGAVILDDETKIKVANLLDETFCSLDVITEGQGKTCTTSVINFLVKKEDYSTLGRSKTTYVIRKIDQSF